MNPPAFKEPRHVHRHQDRRLNALGLSKTLMIATMVIGIGSQFAVITADDFDGDVVVINEYDPFA